MKSERRHELHTNALADWLGGIIERIRPYQTTLLGVVLLAGLLIAVGYVLVRSRVRAIGRRLAGTEPSKIRRPGPNWPSSSRTRRSAAGRESAPATPSSSRVEQQRFVNRATANQHLADAVDFYELVQKTPLAPAPGAGDLRLGPRPGNPRQSRRRQEAVRASQEQWPDGAFADDAAKRLEDLQKPATREFYDDFARFDPKPDYARRHRAAHQVEPFQPDSLSEPEAGPISRTIALHVQSRRPERRRTPSRPRRRRRRSPRRRRRRHPPINLTTSTACRVIRPNRHAVPPSRHRRPPRRKSRALAAA